MPALGGGDDDRALVLGAERGHGLGLRLRHRGDLDHLSLAVEAVELARQARAFGRIVLQQQVDPQRGAPDAPSGIDPRAQQKAEMPRFRRSADPRDVHQRGQPRTVAPAQRHQPLGHEGAVEPFERHHIGDGAERHQIEKAEEIRFRPLRGPEAARAQLAVDRDHGHEHEADGGEVAELREIVETVGIDHGQRRRKQFIGLMVVDHDDVEAELARLEHRFMARGAAIDGDQERRPARGERADRLRIRSVAFEQPIGNMDDRTNAAVEQIPPQHRRRRRSVDIVVAQDGDGLPAHDARPPSARRRSACRPASRDPASARAPSDRESL